MASFRTVRRALCTAAEAAPAPAPAPAPVGRWERLKQSKAGVWCRSLLSDYKEACREVVVGARDRPLKASVYVGLLGGAYACFCTKPDQSSFQAALLDRSNQLALLSPWIRNATSDLHVQNLVMLRNQGRLRHLSLGFVSLVYSTDFDAQSVLYEATCSNLSLPWRELPERVLDVGFAGRWWVLDKKMEDFDVNEAEYKHLPAHMQLKRNALRSDLRQISPRRLSVTMCEAGGPGQATAPPSVQEVERNEKLHKDSWLPIMVQEEEETLPIVVQEEEETLPIVVQEEEETLPIVFQEEEEILPIVFQEEEEILPFVVQEKEEAVERTGYKTEDVKADTADEVQVVDTMETLNINKEEIKQEEIAEDSLVVQTLDINPETQVGQTLDTGALETLGIKEEPEERRVDMKETVEIVDTVVFETVDSPEDGVGEEDVEQTAAQSMKN